MGKLDNEQHERFCHEYLVDFNATRAAIAAKYSKKTAGSQAFDLLKRPDIQFRVRELHSDALKAAKVDVRASVEMVVNELTRIASCDLKDALNPIDGSLLPINDIPEDIRRCISSFEVEEIWGGEKGQRVQIGVVKKVKFWDKNKGLELLGRHFKMYTDKREFGFSESLEALIVASKQTSAQKENGK